MRYRAIFAFIIFIAMATLLFFLHHPQDSLHGGTITEEALKARLYKIGPAAAYKELVTEETDRPNSEQHASGHLFGRLLYEKERMRGFPICDAHLLSGCFHEFVARALIDTGFDVVQQLQSACEEQSSPTDCLHGVGHGLVAYLGYTHSGLEKSLDACSMQRELDPIRGCYGGAFMEMNLETMGDGVPRSFSENHLEGICKDISGKYQLGCFFWLPQWWRESHLKNLPLDNLFESLGSLCIKVATDKDERTSCFQGIGYTVPPAVEFDFAASRKLCSAVSPFMSDQDACWQIASKAAGHKPS